MKGSCELCSNQARIFCDSDQARLCWDCDEKVHGANFLVAKHCRSLLCHVCTTPTPWKASGPKLGPTISVCEKCFVHGCNVTKRGREEEINQPIQRRLREEEEEEETDEFSGSESEDDDDDGDYSSCSDGDDDEDEGENQVVPWSCCSSTDSPEAPLASSSSSEDFVGDGGRITLSVSSTFKRNRRTSTLDHDSDDEDGCSSKLKHNGTSGECGMTSSSGLRPLKIARTSDLIQQIESSEITSEEPERRRLGVISSTVGFQQNIVVMPQL